MESRINEYISSLEGLQGELRSNLREKGVYVDDNDTFSELVPKVSEISSGSSGSEEYEWGYGKYNISIFNTKALITNYQEGKNMETLLWDGGLSGLFEFRNPSDEGFENFPWGMDEHLVMKVRTTNGEEKYIPVVYTDNITQLGESLPRTFKTVGRYDACGTKFHRRGAFCLYEQGMDVSE